MTKDSIMKLYFILMKRKRLFQHEKSKQILAKKKKFIMAQKNVIKIKI